MIYGLQLLFVREWRPDLLMNQARHIHARTLRIGTDAAAADAARLLSRRSPAALAYARAVLVLHPSPPSSLYHHLLSAYESLGRAPQCFPLLSLMRARALPLSTRTFTSLFSAAAAVASSSPALGKQLHAHFLKQLFPFDSFAHTSLLGMYVRCGMLADARRVFAEMPARDAPAWNSMVAGYASCGELEEARRLFEAMPRRNVVSWTSMVSGYSHNGRWEQALGMFLRMEAEREARPNAVTLASVLPACAKLGALEVGERICSFARDNGLVRNVFVGNALIDMYGKCGRIDQAKEVFEGLGRNRNSCSWNSLIMGLAVHGKWKESLELFNEMLVGGNAPDGITITGVLLACTHGGLVEEAQQIFDSMERRFSLSHKLQHYGCMVDLLGRAGLLDRAYSLIESMPMEPDSVVWGALLGACSFHGNVEFAEIAAKNLFELEPCNTGNYVILSNIYASAGRWDGVAKMWKLIKGSNMRKVAGYSYIEIGGRVQKFLSEDRSHPWAEKIYRMLDDIVPIMRLIHHVPYLELVP